MRVCACTDDAAELAQVKIIAGKDKGEVGTIARVLRDQNRVVVEGFNLVRPARRCPKRLQQLTVAWLWDR